MEAQAVETTCNPQSVTILRLKQVIAKTGLSRSTIFDKLNPRSARHDPSFPRQIRLSVVASRGAVGWVESEIDIWLAIRVAESRRSLSRKTSQRWKVSEAY